MDIECDYCSYIGQQEDLIKHIINRHINENGLSTMIHSVILGHMIKSKIPYIALKHSSICLVCNSYAIGGRGRFTEIMDFNNLHKATCSSNFAKIEHLFKVSNNSVIRHYKKKDKPEKDIHMIRCKSLKKSIAYEETIAHEEPINIVASETPVSIVASETPVSIVASETPVSIVASEMPVSIAESETNNTVANRRLTRREILLIEFKTYRTFIKSKGLWKEYVDYVLATPLRGALGP